MRRILAVAATFAVAAGVLVLGTITATAATCTGTVQIDSFAFNPPAGWDAFPIADRERVHREKAAIRSAVSPIRRA